MMHVNIRREADLRSEEKLRDDGCRTFQWLVVRLKTREEQIHDGIVGGVLEADGKRIPPEGVPLRFSAVG